MKIIKYTFEALFVYSLFLIVRILGLKIGRKLIASLFLNIGFVFKSKEIVKKNISYALGQLNENEIKNITEFMWKNYGFTFAEYLYLDKFRHNKFPKPQIKIFGKKVLENLVKSNKPAVFISGHFGNFELMAMELEKNNVNLGAIYRPLNNFFLNPFMVSLRKKYICKKQIQKGKAGAREVIELMKKNYSIALMVDQRLGESERYPFFNKPAHTTTLPAQLALKFGCEIIPVYIERNLDNTFDINIYSPLKINRTDNFQEDKNRITVEINRIIEKMILKNPKQWIWTHNRWK